MRLGRIYTIFMGMALLAVLPQTGFAQDEAAPYVKIRILPERGAIAGGETIRVGIEQSIAPDWHTYWKNPGDSGAPPRVKWTLPPGFSAGEILWPVPGKITYGPLVNYGYSDSVILLQDITAPAEIPQGPLTLAADIEVLVCKEECIPEYGHFEITLNGPEASAEDNAAFLAAAARLLPEPADWQASFAEESGDFVLTIPAEAAGGGAENVILFPADWGLVDNTADLRAARSGEFLVLRQKRGDRALAAVKNMQGVLDFQTGVQSRTVSFTAIPGAVPVSDMPVAAAASAAPMTLLTALAFALLGGVILNLMPCVFPVLSLKALSLVKISEKHPGMARLHGLSYTAGIVLSFLLIAAAMIAFKAAGAGIGWGFQLQNPVVVTLLAYLLFIIGLNLAGEFEISGHFGSIGDRLARGEGLSNSFFAGVLATLVATPCTAPFMAAALGYALVQPAVVALAVFAALGLGLALPYLLLSFIPALRSWLPKPGPWMDIFRQLLAFPMFAAAAWLVWVVSQQVGPMAVLGTLMGLVFVAFALWLLSHKPASRHWRIKTRILAILAFTAALGFLPSGELQQPATSYAQNATAIQSTPYTPESLREALGTDAPVFVEMTAAWCITCKVNHAVAIDVQSTRALFESLGVRYIVGDWTNEDPAITNYLDSYGRNGVPIYVYYGRPDSTGTRPEPKVLPQVLTPGIVKEYLTGS